VSFGTPKDLVTGGKMADICALEAKVNVERGPVRGKEEVLINC
jgi:hypothetical protein